MVKIGTNKPDWYWGCPKCWTNDFKPYIPPKDHATIIGILAITFVLGVMILCGSLMYLAITNPD